MTRTIDPDGTGGGPVISNVVPSPNTGRPYTWQTYPEALTQAGISWRVYQEEDDYGTNVLEFFEAFQNAPAGSELYEKGLTIHGPDRFEWDARNGRTGRSVQRAHAYSSWRRTHSGSVPSSARPVAVRSSRK
jgi:phospholipase C